MVFIPRGRMWYKKRVENPGEVVFEIITQEESAGFSYAIADIIHSPPRGQVGSDSIFSKFESDPIFTLV